MKPRDRLGYDNNMQFNVQTSNQCTYLSKSDKTQECLCRYGCTGVKVCPEWFSGAYKAGIDGLCADKKVAHAVLAILKKFFEGDENGMYAHRIVSMFTEANNTIPNEVQNSDLEFDTLKRLNAIVGAHDFVPILLYHDEITQNSIGSMDTDGLWGIGKRLKDDTENAQNTLQSRSTLASKKKIWGFLHVSLKYAISVFRCLCTKLRRPQDSSVRYIKEIGRQLQGN